ncbi:response regulator [Desulfospira joergensenii]|uniref:response regulator n=1 Tax=Desulfospira joergensenii TaxID=53329 RepID=UPI0003B671D4|nr:response regulator [Desulfospira joergensenii]
MDDQDILKGKRILVVDDEPDILETIEELLFLCEVVPAASFSEAVACLKTGQYDAAILDIMGVQGYSLLKITNRLDIPSLMLTAHALTPDNLKESLEKGADAYVPKDKLVDISLFLADILTARKQGKQANFTWFSLLDPVFDRLFGTDWRKNDPDFWDEFDEKQLDARDDIQKME